MEGFGSLIIRTLAAEEAFPISESIVRFRGGEPGNIDVVHTVFTDEDGVTSTVSLPTPTVDGSLDPRFTGAVYSKYDVTVSKEGYYTKVIRDVAVFPDTLSVLNVAMIPFVSYADGGSVPRNNLITES